MNDKRVYIVIAVVVLVLAAGFLRPLFGSGKELQQQYDDLEEKYLSLQAKYSQLQDDYDKLYTDYENNMVDHDEE